MQRVRLLVLSEREAVYRGLTAILTSLGSFEIVGKPQAGLDAAAEAQRSQPDAVLYEMAPGEEGLRVIRFLKEACPCTVIIVFMENDAPAEVRAAIAAGADSCLVKTMLPGQLAKAVELICLAGVCCFPGSLKRLLNGSGDHCYGGNGDNPAEKKRCDVAPPGLELKARFPLTNRELEIYHLLTLNYTNKDIAKKLYISEPTVKSHVSSILRKLGLNNRTQVMMYEMRKSLPVCGPEQKNSLDVAM